MEFGFNPETITLALLLISVVYAFIVTWKKHGFKKALIAMMRTIESVKVDQETKEKVDAAIMIANEIRLKCNKRSTFQDMAKVGRLIDEVYHAEVKDISKWKRKFDEAIIN